MRPGTRHIAGSEFSSIFIDHYRRMEAENSPRREMRLRGMVLSTSVQADRQGPSMMTRSPDCLTFEKNVK
jgi:hypothetical protein